MTQTTKYANIVITNAGSGGTFAPSSVGIAGSYTLDNNWVNDSGVSIQSTLKVNGDADINGDLRIKGHSIQESLARIEERLGILVPNPELEQEWFKLADLRQQYVELERELLEKQRVFDILKKSD